jgi:hypothetical protein
MRALLRLVGLVVLVAATVVACGDDEDGADEGGGSTTTSAPGEQTTSTTSDPSSSSSAPSSSSTDGANGTGTIDASPASVPLTEAYGDGAPAVAPGDVTVHWYQAGGVYVALYTGEGLGDLPPLCPGNSLAVPSGEYENVSNAPTAEGGCDGIDSTITDVTVCDAAWLFPTAIPADAEGQLFASISSPDSTAGVLGFVPTGEVPEIDVTATSFTVAPGVLANGATELSC